MKNLTSKEKKEIFWALLEKYPSYQRSRFEAKNLFHDKPEQLEKAFELIGQNELASYVLLKKFAAEVPIELPAYSSVNPK